MNRNRFFVFGCLGAIALISALVAIIYVSVSGEYNLARSRWDTKGSSDYTLVVSQYCFCGLVGEYNITVQSGRVTEFEPVNADPPGWAGSGTPGFAVTAKPADFDRMTVAAMLSQAKADQADAWTAPWTHQLHIVYDPTYGYVTKYDADANGQIARWTGSMVTDSGYSYAAHDLVLTGSAP